MIKTRCTQGWLILDDRSIRIEGAQFNQALSRNDITSFITKPQVPSFFGRGGGVELTVQEKGGNILQAQMVNPKIAKEIIEELGDR